MDEEKHLVSASLNSPSKCDVHRPWFGNDMIAGVAAVVAVAVSTSFEVDKHVQDTHFPYSLSNMKRNAC